MKGYKGKILIVKHLGDGVLANHIQLMFDEEWARVAIAAGRFALLAETDADVTFSDTREQEIKAMEAAIEKERAESQHKVNVMLGRIRDLQAIGHDGAARERP